MVLEVMGPMNRTRLAFAALVLAMSVALPGAASKVLLELDPTGTGTAGGGSVVVIHLRCFEFHPDVVEVRNGDLVRFEHADTCANLPHTATSTGSTLDAQQDLSRPQPNGLFVGDCFDSPADLLAFLTQERPIYEVRLDLVGALVARGWGGAEPHPCVGSNSAMLEDSSNEILGVLPFHCRVHGGNQDPGLGMRGALVLRA